MSISTLVDKLIITLCNSGFFLKQNKKCQLKTRSLNILSTFIKKFSPPIATAIVINIVLILFRLSMPSYFETALKTGPCEYMKNAKHETTYIHRSHSQFIINEFGFSLLFSEK